MNLFRSPALVLGLLYLCFFGYLASSSTRLPDRVASHFDGSGRPDGWMSRREYLRSMTALALAFPLFVPVLTYAIRFLPDRHLNIPNRGYWLAPERRAETMAHLCRHSLWFSSMALCFVTGMEYSTLQANRMAEPHLPTPFVLTLAGCFVAGTAVWVVSMIRHFNRVA